MTEVVGSICESVKEKEHIARAANGVPIQINENTPAHIVNMALLIKNNAAIKRYAALGIINLMRQAGKCIRMIKCISIFSLINLVSKLMIL